MSPCPLSRSSRRRRAAPGGGRGAADGSQLPAYLPGQHLVLRLGAAGAAAVARIYSLCGPPGHEGQVDANWLRAIGAPKDADFYLCGPPTFMAALEAGLEEWGVGRERIHAEVFGSGPSLTPGVVGAGVVMAPHQPDGPAGTGPSVTFLRSGLTTHWDRRYNSLLELAEACSVPVRWSCRSGVCHNWETGVVDGSVRYAPEPLDPPAEGSALICCATPVSDVQLDL